MRARWDVAAILLHGDVGERYRAAADASAGSPPARASSA
jgi:hypothetical protein